MPFKKGETPVGAIPFVKGKSGNPSGKPRKLPKLEILLADVLGEEKDGIEAAKAILMSLRAKATKGDVRAAELLLDRAYGKVKQEIRNEISGSLTTGLDISKLSDTALKELRDAQNTNG